MPEATEETEGRDSSIGITTGYELDRIPVGDVVFRTVQTGPGTHPASFTLGIILGLFPGGKAAEAWC
jgi:hypothetical protein